MKSFVEAAKAYKQKLVDQNPNQKNNDFFSELEKNVDNLVDIENDESWRMKLTENKGYCYPYKSNTTTQLQDNENQSATNTVKKDSSRRASSTIFEKINKALTQNVTSKNGVPGDNNDMVEPEVIETGVGEAEDNDDDEEYVYDDYIYTYV